MCAGHPHGVEERVEVEVPGWHVLGRCRVRMRRSGMEVGMYIGGFGEVDRAGTRVDGSARWRRHVVVGTAVFRRLGGSVVSEGGGHGSRSHGFVG